MKTRRIAVYNLHVPLDNYSKYSTSKTLADVLGIKVEKKFAPYFGSMCGVIGTIDLDKTSKVKKRFEKVLGHKSMLYKYGTDKINKHKVTIVAGGGNNLEILQEIPKDCNLHITGITKKNSYSQKSYDYAKKRKLNILGGTHYSTEKFACISMVEYFKKQGLPCKFISGKPVMEDI